MKISSSFKIILAILLIIYPMAITARTNDLNSSNSANASESKSSNEVTTKQARKYSGYSVDGRTSASVLAAKRSHSASKQDEMGLAMFSGLIVIGLIVFFVQTLSKKK